MDGYVQCMHNAHAEIPDRTGIHDVYVRKHGHGHGLVWLGSVKGLHGCLASANEKCGNPPHSLAPNTRHPFSCATIQCINHIMYSSTCTNSNVPHLLIRIENPAMHPSPTIGARCLFSHNKPQTMYPTPPQLSNHRAIIVFPSWLAAFL